MPRIAKALSGMKSATRRSLTVGVVSVGAVATAVVGATPAAAWTPRHPAPGQRQLVRPERVRGVRLEQRRQRPGGGGLL